MFNVRYTLSIHSSRYKMLPCFNRVIVCDYLILLFVQYFLCCKVTTHFEKNNSRPVLPRLETDPNIQIEIVRKHRKHTFSFLQNFSSLTPKRRRFDAKNASQAEQTISSKCHKLKKRIRSKISNYFLLIFFVTKR